jgi:pSer/pThr/pTyr-binding forkhead associated (FHA) protein
MAGNPERYFEIEFLSGPRDGEVVIVATTRVIVGRDRTLDVPILGDTVVSRRHAQLRWEGGKILLEDLGSSFGTHVNREKIAGARVLHETDIVCVGHTEFVCRLPRPAMAALEEKDQAAEVDSTR